MSFVATVHAAPMSGEVERPIQPVRPNFVFILADDLGWLDTGFMGSTFYETPHIDQLAREGIVFTDAYANAPNCAPTRASLLSGQYTPRHRIFTVPPAARGKASHRRLLVPETETELPLEVVTIAEALQAAGYATGSVGKWHLGRRGHGPTDQGFDYSIGGNARGIPPSYHWPYQFTSRRGDSFRIRSLERGGAPGEYLTDRLTDEAIHWLDAHHTEPFFLYLSHYAVHAPHQAKPALEAKYREKGGGAKSARYAAMIESLDDGVGRVLAHLRKLGVAEDTVVFFFSDNGGAGSVTSMAPLRGTKGTLYEGGIREPLIVRWPRHGRSGVRSGVPVIGTDFYPTILDIAQVPRPENHVLDGVSLVPLIRAEGPGTLEQRDLYWHFPAYLEAGPDSDELFRTTPAGAIRRADYKLIEFFEDGQLELYDLRKDIGEEKNLASSMPEKVRELRAGLAGWRKSVGASVPADPNPDFASGPR